MQNVSNITARQRTKEMNKPIVVGESVRFKGQPYSPTHIVMRVSDEKADLLAFTGVTQGGIPETLGETFRADIAIATLEVVPPKVNGITVGSLVMIRSGGPDMTVTRMENDFTPISACCVWSENGRRTTDVFPLEALRISSNDS